MDHSEGGSRQVAEPFEQADASMEVNGSHTNGKMADDKTEDFKPPSRPTATAPDEDLLTKIMNFFASASPGTLGAIAVGLGAMTYFILGQIGLLLIGAFVGITTFVAWEARNPEAARAIRGEKGYDFLERILETRTSSKSAASEEDEEAEARLVAQSFDDFPPQTRQALQDFVDATIRDYVDYWYAPIIPSDKSFPLSARKVFTNFMLAISNQLSRKRPADAFIDFLTHSCSIMIVFFTEMTAAHATLPSDSTATAADYIYNYLATDTDSPLSNLLNQRQQAGKFKMVAEDLIGFLDRQTYDCDPARVFLREAMASLVLEGTLQTCSKAEWINGWIVYLLEAGETDLSQAIDDAIQEQKAYADVDGNVGNISLSKGNRNNYQMERDQKQVNIHKEKLSRDEEEMEDAMKEVNRLNQMIAEADHTNTQAKVEEAQISGLLGEALERNAKELDLNMNREEATSLATAATKTNLSETTALSGDSSLHPSVVYRENSGNSATASPVADVVDHHQSPNQKQEAPSGSNFTSFDQIAAPVRDELDGEKPVPKALSLFNAAITIHDDPGSDKGRLRTKPNWEYLVQIELSSSQDPGWMAMKTYSNFEALHESLRRIAAVSGAAAFLEAYSVFPSWKVHTRSSLRGDIERYMRVACAEKPLADSEAMKRFLEKGQESRVGVNRGFSFESVGKGMLGAIQNAPKGALDSGKVVVGGVTGVLGNIGLGQRKPTNSSLPEGQIARSNSGRSPGHQSLSSLPQFDTISPLRSKDSFESQRSSVIQNQPGKVAPMERRASYQVDYEGQGYESIQFDQEPGTPSSAVNGQSHGRSLSLAAPRTPARSPSQLSLSGLNLPPPPEEITDDYESPIRTRASTDRYNEREGRALSPQAAVSSPSGTTAFDAPPTLPERPSQKQSVPDRPRRRHAPLTEQETRVAVELLFAVINELYTLSSVWNIRRTLLTAAKTFLIRPGNPSMASIQSVIQESVLDANTSDAGVAAQLQKLRENSLPTEEERKTWPAPLTSEEKEELRVKARRLFIQSSVPAALMGIMGQSATAEALGRLFDCLQIEEVARGLFFGLMLQAARVVTSG